MFPTTPSRQARSRVRYALIAVGLLTLCASTAAAQTYGSLTLEPGFLPDPQRLAGTAGGSNPTDYYDYSGETSHGYCRGWIASNPDHVLNVTRAFSHLDLAVESTIDTTLVIVGPEGVWCNDDRVGLNPGIGTSFPAGTYNIWVGSYYEADYAPYSIQFSEYLHPSQIGHSHPVPHHPSEPVDVVRPADLDTSGVVSNFEQTALTSGFVSTPHHLAGMSGGDLSLFGLTDLNGAVCAGWATRLPDHIITLNSWFSYLQFSVVSDGDTTLVLHGPDGYRCNDDFNELNPAIDGSFSPGTYRVWVGSYGAERTYHYELSVLEFPAVTGPTAPMPTPEPILAGLDPSSYRAQGASLVVSPGFAPNPQVVFGVSGGVESIATVDSSCRGYADRDPDHILSFSAYMSDLTLAVSASGDTTLAVHGPNGWSCNDDSDGVNPALGGSWSAGTYRVWVGSYLQSETSEYSLTVTEAGPVPNLEFRGSFEGSDVFFSAAEVDTLYSNCQAYMSSIGGANTVDDITVFGAAYHNGPGYWGSEVLCSLVALNARPDDGSGAPLITGLVEGLPISVYGSYDDATSVLGRYLRAAASGSFIDDVVIDGVGHHYSAGYWTADQVVAMFRGAVVHPDATVIVRGDIEGIPFVFSGQSHYDIQNQCASFVSTVVASNVVDDVTVNGQARHNGPGYWSEAEICMLISSMAN